MRVKTEARRNAIVVAAAEAFRERGFEAASMADVASRVGGSKATLYNYFDSKEALFAAVMMQAAKAQAVPIFDALRDAADLDAGLRRFGRDYLAFMLQPDLLQIKRIVIADGGRTGVGRDVFEQGIKVAWSKVCERLREAMDAGELRQADPWVASWHLKGLLEAGVIDRALRGCAFAPEPSAIPTSVDAAVDVYLRAYSA